MTTQATHTPGPWRIYENPNLEPDDAHAIGVTMDTRGRDMRNDVAACNLLGLDLDECKANARLIAAAPDLLEALKNARESLREITNCVEDGWFDAAEDWARANASAINSSLSEVIAKAEGRTE